MAGGPGGLGGAAGGGKSSPTKEPAFTLRPKTIVCYIW
jgi:hypothetical protein